MTALRSGVILFGLVVLTVKLFSATEEHPVRLQAIHAADSAGCSTAGSVKQRTVKSRTRRSGAAGNCRTDDWCR
ncbi:hypothetical protein OG698_01655 [Streptomyces sp. NBC_01003]|uniref:hypothetical protein n=1 Tax=Streptomyces sp. NBC_01003 TaxID=2903714 RepID=UPI003862F242|nr:hypothetical protein OG698_01655 [Streptomyces sp. NBC_01003]